MGTVRSNMDAVLHVDANVVGMPDVTNYEADVEDTLQTDNECFFTDNEGFVTENEGSATDDGFTDVTDMEEFMTDTETFLGIGIHGHPKFQKVSQIMKSSSRQSIVYQSHPYYLDSQHNTTNPNSSRSKPPYLHQQPEIPTNAKQQQQLMKLANIHGKKRTKSCVLSFAF